METLMRSLVIAALGLSLAGCTANIARERQQARLDLAESLAGESVDRVSYPRLMDWEPLSEERMILWTRINEAWLLSVERCPELPWAQTIIIPTQARQIRTTFDTVRVESRHCRILEIRALDARALRQGSNPRRIEQAQDEAGGT